MTFTVVPNGSLTPRDKVVDALVRTILAHGHVLAGGENGVNFALNLTDESSPRSFRRRSQSVFVFTIIQDARVDGEFKSRCYTALVKSLSNLLLCVVPSDSSAVPEIYFTTPEAGFYHIPFDPEAVYERLMPIASSHFATENRFSFDLPEALWDGSAVTDQIARYGRELDAMGVLPTPFPLRQVLTEEALRQLYKIYGITGASYGNLSARETASGEDARGDVGQGRPTHSGEPMVPPVFWMTGRGVDKSNIRLIGRDVLLVKGFDRTVGAALISQPSGAPPAARVSVDAIEHFLIYSTFPDVGAIVHAHAWMDGVLCTRQNYPCGTVELAQEVVDLLARTPDPTRAAVGLKNHGLTITGIDLAEIFARIRGKLLREVAMFA